MAVSAGPNLVEDDLVFYLDAANSKSNRGRRSLINWDSWVAGTVGSATGYDQNGDGNSRILDTNPFGAQDVVWDVSNQDAAVDDDGGWDGANFPIDNTKMYRFSVWIRRKWVGNGNYYFGCYGVDSVGTNTGVLRRDTGITDTNPYFDYGSWTYGANTWVLFVGHVWPANSGTGNQHPDSGRYLVNGTKLGNVLYDCVWNSDNAYSFHRSYLYYSSDTLTNQQFYQPRVDLCDGTEPTIAELLDDAGNKLYDLSRNENSAALINGPTYNSNNLGSINFDGVNDYVVTPSLNFSNTSQWSFSFWGRIDSYNASFPGFIYRGGGGSTGFIVFYNATNLFFKHDNSNYAVVARPSFGIPFNFTVTHNGAGLAKTYINGIQLAEHGIVGDCSGEVLLGRADEFGDVGIYSFSKYDRSLSADEIKQNFNAHRGRYGI